MFYRQTHCICLLQRHLAPGNDRNQLSDDEGQQIVQVGIREHFCCITHSSPAQVIQIDEEEEDGDQGQVHDGDVNSDPTNDMEP